MSALRNSQRSLRFWAALIVLWTVPGLIGAGIVLQRAAAEGNSIPLWRAFVYQAPFWYLWAVLSPVIFGLGRRFPFDGYRWHVSLPVHMVAGSGIALLHLLIGLAALRWASPANPELGFLQAYRNVIGGYFEFELLIYVAILVAGFAYDYYQRVREGEFRETVLEAQLAQSRLQALKMQLQPHFLFNTLHAVSSLMGEDVKAARRMLARLGELLRLTLDSESVEEVPLRRELEFLERYLDIERERFSDRLEVDFQIDEETLDALVPYFILQPLVENAVRHGIGTCGDCGRIVVTASRSNSDLKLCVTDTGSGFPVGVDSHQREGVGLSNTRARLEHMYGTQHDFEISSDPGEGCSVALSVPFREVGNGHNSDPHRR